jgi:endonuclease/exonuclease/phosphatase family metal-dependent hydrolase
MSKKIFLFLLISLTAVNFGCQTNQYVISPDQNTITLATFNVEWLGDGIHDTKPRTSADYEKIAKIIYMTNADIIALQEVENDQAMELVSKYLVGYHYYVSGDGEGKQNTAILYNPNLEIRIVGNYEPLDVKKHRTRAGLLSYVKKGNFDFILMDVHLKSTSRYDSTDELREESYSLRNKQAKVISHWADSIETNSKEKDVIVLGDFNDNPNRTKHFTLEPIVNDTNLSFLTADLHSCKNPKWDNIDNIVVTKTVLPRVIKNSLHQINFYQILSKKEAESISDHCPVVISFDIKQPDND